MADPITMMAGSSILGGIMGASGAVEQAQQQANQLRAQQQAAEFNAKTKQLQAQVAGREATSAANLQATRSRSMISKQRALQAQNNYFGQTADQLLDVSSANAELDRLNIVYQGESKAKGLQSSATLDQYQANIYGSQIQPTLNAGAMKAGGALLGGIGQAGYLASQQPVDPYMNWGKF